MMMQEAALSAILAPKCRNSQRGVRKLLVAVAADEEGPQHCDINISVILDSTVEGPAPTLRV